MPISVCVIAVALAPEARPFIERYQLKKDYGSLVFPVYRSNSLPLCLIVTGIGKVAMACAVGYLQHYLRLNAESTYLNVGIAGSQYFSLGEAVLAHKIRDAASQKVFYPNLAWLKHGISGELISFDHPQTHYPLNAMVDMEAAAFFAAARRFAFQDGIHVLKVISDTSEKEMRNISGQIVTAGIEAVWEVIDKVAQSLMQRVSLVKPGVALAEKINDFSSRWHFTVYQKNALQKILRRWLVLLPEKDPLVLCESFASSGQVLRGLNDYLEQIPYEWS